MAPDALPGPETAPPPPIPEASDRAPIAHWTHTAAVLILLAALAAVSHGRADGALDHAPKISRYLSTIVFEWLLLGSVIAGIYVRRGFFVRAFRGSGQGWAASLGMGLAVYIAGTVALAIVALLLQATPWKPHTNEAVVLAMLPHTLAEFAGWLLLSFTAGFAEELIFRGYLLQQFTAWTRRPLLAIGVTSLLFGSLHLYEGPGAILPLAALAMVYGLVVRRFKGDLRAVIVAHTLQDFLVALLVLAKPYLERYAAQHK